MALPMAQISFAEMAEIEYKRVEAPLTEGTLTDFHALPSQLRMRPFVVDEPYVVPTAHASLEDSVATANSPFPYGLGFGVVTCDQALPFQFAANVCKSVDGL